MITYRMIKIRMITLFEAMALEEFHSFIYDFRLDQSIQLTMIPHTKDSQTGVHLDIK